MFTFWTANQRYLFGRFLRQIQASVSTMFIDVLRHLNRVHTLDPYSTPLVIPLNSPHAMLFFMCNTPTPGASIYKIRLGGVGGHEMEVGEWGIL